MRVLVVAAVTLITITLTRCVPRTDKMQNNVKDLTSTTPNSMEEQMDKISNDLRPVMAECNETFRIEMYYLETLNTTGSFPEELDRTPKCFLRCVLEKAEVASADSQFDVSRTADVFDQIRVLPHDDLVKMATTCSDRAETCKCERAYQYLKCLMGMIINKYDTT
ncbi:uncharacterized protein LOC116777154 [Danaus plexippus]|uniref:Antennal binding protein 5 n=1 Tax=Danaus plexippus plexippus TaxID=278856 RepID=A0A212FM40_DANPL|nr:uncharacterized protein LOC116777154 [Danaus plexippus]OWR54818.1 antennal binding protein 5 [Danaus plexippus plexippus]